MSFATLIQIAIGIFALMIVFAIIRRLIKIGCALILFGGLALIAALVYMGYIQT